MRAKRQPIRIPASAVAELEEVEGWDWLDGIPLPQLLDWINMVVARFRPEDIGEGSRASQEFTTRAFRHYQTLGCIDAPERAGRLVVYRFRHFLQGLLIRKLLWEGLSSEKIAALMAGRTAAQYKQLLFEGVEITGRGGKRPVAMPSAAGAEAETWKRVAVAPGVELHLRGDMPKPGPAALREWLALLENALRAHCG